MYLPLTMIVKNYFSVTYIDSSVFTNLITIDKFNVFSIMKIID